jgi:hypothetical protein
MIATERVFTDFEISQNPDASTKVNKFYKFFMPILGIFWIIAGSANLWTKESIVGLHILQIVLGTILLLTFVLQPLFYKLYGRKYISFSENSIEIKINYLRQPLTFLWENISKINIQYSKFEIFQDEKQESVLTFAVPYSKYNEV